MTDTRNHWKQDNLGKRSQSGIIRVAADPNYKGEAIVGLSGVSSTIRAIYGGGTSIEVDGR